MPAIQVRPEVGEILWCVAGAGSVGGGDGPGGGAAARGGGVAAAGGGPPGGERSVAQGGGLPARFFHAFACETCFTAVECEEFCILNHIFCSDHVFWIFFTIY